jgi:hypothetical protein
LNEKEEYRYAKSQKSEAIPFDQAFLEIESSQMDTVRERIADYNNNPDQALDFEKAKFDSDPKILQKRDETTLRNPFSHRGMIIGSTRGHPLTADL